MLILPTVEASTPLRFVYALNNKIILSKLTTKLAFNLFGTLSSPILHCGSEG